MTDALADRRRERERLIALAREYVDTLRQRLPLVAAAVAGSAARGDFNVWSDVDVVVIAEELPERTPERLALLLDRAPAGVQAVGLTPDELTTAVRRRNRLVIEALAEKVWLCGQRFPADAAGAAFDRRPGGGD